MAKRDILKEAIADAKAVKETAIANAKAALEEAFTPQLKSMLAAKLEEMELEEDETKSEISEETVEETVNEETVEETVTEDEELNLDEILAEIETELNEEEPVTEEVVSEENIEEETVTEEESEDAEEAEEDESEEAEEAEDEEINLDDMTDEDLKGFIEDVIADMVASGDLEAGDNFEQEDTEEEVGMEVMDSEEEVEITESTEEVNEDDIEELTVTPGGGSGGATRSIPNPVNVAIAKAVGSAANWTKEKLAAFKQWSDEYEKPNKYAQSGNKAATRPGSSGVGLAEELEEANSAIETLKSELNEVNLLNAKLLYTNKIFKAKSLTESEKVKVLGAFDKAATIKETKLVFETLNEGLKVKKSPIRESLGSASKATGNFKKTKNPIVETDPMVARFQKLAGLK
jgi:hypothetical protein